MNVELARQQWEDGLRRVETRSDDRARYERLLGQVDIVSKGLRQRVGQVFTLAELAEAYDGADEWARGLIDDADPEAPPRTSRERSPTPPSTSTRAARPTTGREARC